MTQYTIVPTASWSIEGHRVVISTAAGRLFTLNRVGSRVWQCVAQHMTVPEITECVVRGHAVDDQVTVSADVERFLARLEGAGLIDRVRA